MTTLDILAPVISIDDDEPALSAALDLGERFQSKPAVLILATHLASAFSPEQAPLSEVLADIGAGSASAAGQERARLTAWLERRAHKGPVHDLTIENAVLDDRAVAHARVADLIVMTRAERHDRARRMLIEDLLFKSGRPLLLLPKGPARARNWDTFVIGWNAKREAVHATMGALPLLRRAKRVVVATVDAKPSAGGHAERPGEDLSAYLARHGVANEIQNIDGLGRTEAAALADAAIAVDADALVLGAYGHSRVQERLFGGVTRELLEAAALPLLLAH